MYLRERGCEVLGVDFDERAAARARAYGVPIHIGPLKEIEGNGTFDIAVCQHSLEHVTRPDEVVRQLARLVKPGGTLHIAVPNGESAGLATERAGWGALFCPGHLWYFDRASLSRLLIAEGFEPATWRYKTIWRDHWALWRSDLHKGRVLASTWRLVCFLLALTRSRAGGDTLRLVAYRVPSPPAAPLDDHRHDACSSDWSPQPTIMLLAYVFGGWFSELSASLTTSATSW
jgi:SAM-dependent methyltransferase